jgi:2-amino-4-hydroxy-6-hydroxymethyldihydropteridine diphosphokinase
LDNFKIRFSFQRDKVCSCKKLKIPMIYVGLGANLESPLFGRPVRTLEAALALLDTGDCRVVRRSSWYESAPVPLSDQPWFVNGVAQIATALSPHRLLSRLLEIEREIGRVRTIPNAPRLVDLDLLAYGDDVLDAAPRLIVPHPRLNDRAFGLLPLRELAPDWIDPRTGRSIEDLIGDLPADQICRPLNHDEP